MRDYTLRVLLDASLGVAFKGTSTQKELFDLVYILNS